MNWLTNLTPPGMKKIFRQRDDTGNTNWLSCPSCSEMIFIKDLVPALQVCPNCDHHMRLDPKQRLDHIFSSEDWEKIDLPEVAEDPLKFKDIKPYPARLKDARKKTGEPDALVMGLGSIGDAPAVAVIQNFAFMGGSMGMRLGEGIITAATKAVETKSALIIFASSGGARMQEGILSLMQMPRTTIAVQMVRDANLPYIVVLTNPTTGGVTASYAMLGDVHLAEPGALIGFAGPRVIEQTIREKLPEGFQRSEYLVEKGMVDQVVHRHDLPETLGSLLKVLMKKVDSAPATQADPEVPAAVNDDDELPRAAE